MKILTMQLLRETEAGFAALNETGDIIRATLSDAAICAAVDALLRRARRLHRRYRRACRRELRSHAAQEAHLHRTAFLNLQ